MNKSQESFFVGNQILHKFVYICFYHITYIFHVITQFQKKKIKVHKPLTHIISFFFFIYIITKHNLVLNIFHSVCNIVDTSAGFHFRVGRVKRVRANFAIFRCSHRALLFHWKIASKKKKYIYTHRYSTIKKGEGHVFAVEIPFFHFQYKRKIILIIQLFALLFLWSDKIVNYFKIVEHKKKTKPIIIICIGK